MLSHFMLGHHIRLVLPNLPDSHSGALFTSNLIYDNLLHTHNFQSDAPNVSL